MTVTFPSYPDWQGMPTWHSNAIVDTFEAVPSSPPMILGPFPTPNFAGANLIVSMNSGNGFVSFIELDDIVNVSSKYGASWVVTSNTELITTIPIQTNAFAIQLSNGMSFTSTFNVFCNLTNNVSGEISYPHASAQFSTVAYPIAAGGTATFYQPAIKPGQYGLFFGQYASPSNMRLEVRYQQGDGTLGVPLLYVTNPAQQYATILEVGTSPIAVKITNLDGVNSNQFDLSVSV